MSEGSSIDSYNWEGEDDGVAQVDKIDMTKLVEKMRDPDHGVKICTRYYLLKPYYRCFIGMEAVDWLVKELRLSSREDAVAIGQAMMYRGLLKKKEKKSNYNRSQIFQYRLKITQKRK